MKTAYKSIVERIGDPLEEGTLYGPLHNQAAVDAYEVRSDLFDGVFCFIDKSM